MMDVLFLAERHADPDLARHALMNAGNACNRPRIRKYMCMLVVRHMCVIFGAPWVSDNSGLI